jgi:tRNA U38,U39,U40 pseudouridine synthase TruA
MAGALLDIGRRRISLEDFETLLEQPQPGASLFTAPARGLTLERVFYRHSTLLESQ